MASDDSTQLSLLLPTHEEFAAYHDAVSLACFLVSEFVMYAYQGLHPVSVNYNLLLDSFADRQLMTGTTCLGEGSQRWNNYIRYSSRAQVASPAKRCLDLGRCGRDQPIERIFQSARGSTCTSCFLPTLTDQHLLVIEGPRNIV